MTIRSIFSTLLLISLTVLGGAPAAAPSHGIAMHGDLKYEADFRHLDYVDPDAPKGGELRRAVRGTFDNLNPFLIKGVPAHGRHLVFESLLKRTWDEPFSLYGLIAETVAVPDDRSSVAFTLRPEARFHDGRPITVDDVVFSWETLKEKGRPNHRLYYKQVRRIERPGERTVRFVFDADPPDRELPLILGLMPIVSKDYYADVEFEKTTLVPPVGSGPYRVESVDPGRRIVYRRDPAYWGRDLAVNRGQHNFDRVRYDYYRDGDVMIEAFKAGEYDLRLEFSGKRWATAYDFPAAGDGRVTLETLPNGRPSGMTALVFNSRREIFADRRVRYALAHAFDFETVNRTLLHGAYRRTRSIFDNSELGSRDVPEGRELALLEPFRSALPPELFEGPYRPPGVEGGIRKSLRAAKRILAEAGWAVRDGALKRAKDGLGMAFEILLVDPANEKIALAFARNLRRLGAAARVRTVDTSQYQYRRNTYDFDMIVYRWGMSLSPGNEQAFYWGSKAAGQEGTRNYPGIRNPAVDRLIERMTEARGREVFVDIVRAMDRVLLWGHHFVPLYHLRGDRVAYWNRFGRPGVTPLYGLVIDAWWEDPTRAGVNR
ncbi:MAG: extracellular solute-binding protein [Defluviicoccus sp.]|nr:extracellular solute-binding protein [Defluviicoccus sp.]MDE0277201.1 extracellular solute-binding protein [Defluviicoccus sp.]